MIKKIFGKIVSFVVPSQVTGIFKGAQKALEGKKTYLAGAILLLQSLMMLVEQFVGLNNVSDIIGVIKNFAESEGFIRLAEALAVFGLRAALPFKKA